MRLRKSRTLNLRADLSMFVGVYERPIVTQRYVSLESGSPEKCDHSLQGSFIGVYRYI